MGLFDTDELKICKTCSWWCDKHGCENPEACIDHNQWFSNRKYWEWMEDAG